MNYFGELKSRMDTNDLDGAESVSVAISEMGESSCNEICDECGKNNWNNVGHYLSHRHFGCWYDNPATYGREN